MIARMVTLGGQVNQYGLLCAKPNWETPIAVAMDLPTDIAKEPITFNESRRAFAQSCRYSMKWTAYMFNAADAAELRIFLTRLRGEPLIVPMWPDVCETSLTAVAGSTVVPLVDVPTRAGAFWIIGTDDFSDWEIVSGILQGNSLRCTPGIRKTWIGGTHLYPVMVGRFTDRPQPDLITDETFEVELSVKENSEFAFRLGAFGAGFEHDNQHFVGDHIPAFRTLPLWTFAPNFDRPLDWTEMPDIVYQQIRFLRTEQQRAYDHRNARGIEFEFYENDRDTILAIERFWRDRRANVRRFMVPTYRGDFRMLSDTPYPGATRVVAVERTEFSDPGREQQPGDAYIAFIGPDDTVDPYQIKSMSRTPEVLPDLPIIVPPDSPPAAGIDLLTTTVDIGPHTADNTRLSHLMLARFVEARLEWTYTTPYLASTRIKFQELPHEYANTPAELAEPAYLFIFNEVGVRVDLFTSYENTINLTVDGTVFTFVVAPFSFDSIKTGLKLDQEKLDLQSFKFDGNPLNKLWPFALDGTLTLDVLEVDARNPQYASARNRFSGEVWSVDANYKATILAFGNFFERKFPRDLIITSDNYTQFSPPTNIPASAFKITGTIANLDSQTIVITSATAHAKEADYFSGGWLETINTGQQRGSVGTPKGGGITVAGSLIQGPTVFTAGLEKRGILHSEPTGANQVTLHIDRPLLKAQVGQSIDVYPGYDGSIDQCDTKFHNRLNFGGYPYVPQVSPFVKAINAKQPQGGKK